MINSVQPQNIKVVLFTPKIILSKPIEIANHFMSNVSIGDLYNGQPMILPIPQDAPSEIPRIILKNTDGSFICNISQDRVDFTFNRKGSNASLDDESKKFLNYLIGHIDVINNNLKLSVARVGIVVSLLLPLKESSNKFISEKFLKERLFEDSYEVQLGVLKKVQLAGFETNCWFRLNTLRNQKNPSDDRALLITYDVNTQKENSYDLNRDQIGILFNSAIKYMTDSLKVYLIE